MTGAYLRVHRDGKWQSLEVEYLTDDERKMFLTGGSKGEVKLLLWLNLVCKRLVSLEEKEAEFLK